MGSWDYVSDDPWIDVTPGEVYTVSAHLSNAAIRLVYADGTPVAEVRAPRGEVLSGSASFIPTRTPVRFQIEYKPTRDWAVSARQLSIGGIPGPYHG